MFGTTIGSSIGSSISKSLDYKSMKSTPAKVKTPRFHDFIADYGGCGHWRMIWPQMIINGTQKMFGSNSAIMISDESYYKSVSSVRIQRQVTSAQLSFASELRRKADRIGFKFIYDIDDIFVIKDIPMYNAFRSSYDNAELQDSAKKILNLVDMVTVTCDTMKDYYSQFNDNVVVVKNYPPRFWLDGIYDHETVMNNWTRKRTRIMYCGSGAHFDLRNNNNGVDDISHIVKLIRKTCDVYEWVFMGGEPPAIKDLIKSGKVTVHKWQSIYNLPRFIKNLNINIFIAPLHDNIFNRCKSDIKILEAGALGVPCICQDMITYDNSPLKFKTADDLHDQIELLRGDYGLYSKLSKCYNDVLQSRWLDDNYQKYIDIL